MTDDIKNQVKTTFSKNADSYVSSTTHKNQYDLDLITEWLAPQPNWKALDIATGGGHVAKELSRSAGVVFATDLTKDMLQNTASHLQEIPNIHYVIADAEELPFIDESFDVVTCRIAPHHFPSPPLFIKEVARVLKRGGRFLMIDNVVPEQDDLDHFYNTFEKMRDPSHARALKITEWQQLLEENELPIQRSLTREKQMAFRSWLERTVDNLEIQKKVEQFFLSAGEGAIQTFSIKTENGRVQSFAIPEWKVLCQKQN